MHNFQTILSHLLDSGNLDPYPEARDCLHHFDSTDWVAKPGVDIARYNALLEKGCEEDLDDDELDEFMSLVCPKEGMVQLYYWIWAGKQALAKAETQQDPAIGREVSVDISSGEADADARVFARIVGRQDDGTGQPMYLAEKTGESLPEPLQSHSEGPVYRHAYDFWCEVHSDCEEGSDVTGAQLRASLLAKVNALTNDELLEVCQLADVVKVGA